MYRDGVGGPSMEVQVLEKEVKDIVESISSFAKDYRPKIVYTLVNKKISHRLFVK